MVSDERRMVQIYLVRHGEVAWNRERPAYCGSTDLDLTAEGHRQAQLLAERLSDVPLTAVYSSDLRRALDTAAAIAAPHGLEPLPEPLLCEVDYGEWEGVAEEEVRTRWPEVYRAWRADPAAVRIPGGESFADLSERVWTALTGIAARHPGQAVAVVGHKSVNRVFLCRLFSLPISAYRRIGQENAALNILNEEDGRWRVDLVNDTCHLRWA